MDEKQLKELSEKVIRGKFVADKAQNDLFLTIGRLFNSLPCGFNLDIKDVIITDNDEWEIQSIYKEGKQVYVTAKHPLSSSTDEKRLERLGIETNIGLAMIVAKYINNN